METVMRAVVQTELGGPEVLTLTEIPRPEPGPGEILVRVEAAGVNPIDCKTRASGGLLRASPPFTVGWDVSGVVEAVGRGVRLHQVGDEVYGMPSFPRFAGGYAEYVAAPARHFDRKPAGLSHIEAAALPLAALTARQALVDTAGLGAGLRVLVHAGAGGVGHLAVQIAGSLGAFVIATASPRKTGFVRKLGADVVLDYTAADFAADLADVDVVLDAVGGDCTTRSAAVLREGGTLVSLTQPGTLAETDQGRISAGYMLVEPDHAGLQAISTLVEAGALTPTVSRTFPLDQSGLAHKALEAGRTVGKIVLTVP